MCIFAVGEKSEPMELIDDNSSAKRFSRDSEGTQRCTYSLVVLCLKFFEVKYLVIICDYCD